MKGEKKVCPQCGKEFIPKRHNQKFCGLVCYGISKRLEKLGLGEEKIFSAPDVKMYVRIVSPREEYHFKNLRQAVNFLSVYSSCTAAECLTLLKQHENKIDKWKIFYD